LPTYDIEARFWNDFRRLKPSEQEMFLEACTDFIRALETWEATGFRALPRFPGHLRVKPLQG